MYEGDLFTAVTVSLLRTEISVAREQLRAVVHTDHFRHLAYTSPL